MNYEQLKDSANLLITLGKRNLISYKYYKLIQQVFFNT